MDQPTVLIVTHGSRGPLADPDEAGRFARAVSQLVDGVDVQAATLSEEGAWERALDGLSGRPTLVIPHFMSDGYFYANRVKPLVIDALHTLAQPTALWPEFAPFLAAELSARADERLDRCDILLVAHGSEAGGASARTAHRIAADLDARLNRPVGATRACFLEEPPFAAEAFTTQQRTFVAIGLFVGAGRHGRADFEKAVAKAPRPPIASFIVADAAGLDRLVASRVQGWLATLPG